MKDICFKAPEIYRPADNIDKTLWSIVACDQYTSQPEYWERVRKTTQGKPSTLNLILPEIYLGPGDELLIDSINKTMREYDKSSVMVNDGEYYTYIERTITGGEIRKGILLAVDLDKYEFKKGSNSEIKASEATVEDRIPPRLRVRKNAEYELPHVLLLYNDEKNIINNFMKSNKNGWQVLYDFDLMENGGHIKGYRIPSEYNCVIENMFVSLKCRDGMQFAVGDGNHSLATAKKHWDNIKNNVDADHPARYALAEAVNIQDESLVFEPIHRIIIGISLHETIEEFEKWCNKYGLKYNIFDHEICDNDNILRFAFTGEDAQYYVNTDNTVHPLSVGTVQAFIDDLKTVRPEITVDYIHGDDVVRELCEKKHGVGVILPAIDKSGFFNSISQKGSLPRKTFSMGEANDKRYYYEARKIVK